MRHLALTLSLLASMIVLEALVPVPPPALRAEPASLRRRRFFATPSDNDNDSDNKENQSNDEVAALLRRAKEMRREAEALEKTLPPPAVRAEMTRPSRAQDTALQASVRRWVVDAYDNLPPSETAEKFDLLWEKGESKTVDSLVELSERADRLEKALKEDRVDPGLAMDEVRVLRSRIRMVSKAAIAPSSFKSPFELVTTWLRDLLTNATSSSSGSNNSQK